MSNPPRVALDCLTCGACCYQRPGTILVTESDIEGWQAAGQNDILENLEPGHFGFRAFKMSEMGCCVFHGTAEQPHACRIYGDRAHVCRDFEAGSAQCLEFRRDRGVK